MPATIVIPTPLVIVDDTASVTAEGGTVTRLQQVATGTGTGHPQPILHLPLLPLRHPHHHPFIQPPRNPVRCPFPTFMDLHSVDTLALDPQKSADVAVVADAGGIITQELAGALRVPQVQAQHRRPQVCAVDRENTTPTTNRNKHGKSRNGG